MSPWNARFIVEDIDVLRIPDADCPLAQHGTNKPLFTIHNRCVSLLGKYLTDTISSERYVENPGTAESPQGESEDLCNYPESLKRVNSQPGPELTVCLKIEIIDNALIQVGPAPRR